MTEPSGRLQVRSLTVGPLEENCWLLVDPGTKSAVLVDPGDEPERLLEAVTAAGATLSAIWLTHAHFDHVGGVAGIRRLHDVPVLMHADDRLLYERAADAAARWGITLEPPGGTTTPVTEGDSVRVGAFTFQVWHLPGHAPGHVAFIGHGLCASGDLLFAGSIGRTDLPFCDPDAMQASLARLATLPAETRVLPGHGGPTTIGREQETNPFLRGLARPVGA